MVVVVAAAAVVAVVAVVAVAAVAAVAVGAVGAVGAAAAAAGGGAGGGGGGVSNHQRRWQHQGIHNRLYNWWIFCPVSAAASEARLSAGSPACSDAMARFWAEGPNSLLIYLEPRGLGSAILQGAIHSRNLANIVRAHTSKRNKACGTRQRQHQLQTYLSMRRLVMTNTRSYPTPYIGTHAPMALSKKGVTIVSPRHIIFKFFYNEIHTLQIPKSSSLLQTVDGPSLASLWLPYNPSP